MPISLSLRICSLLRRSERTWIRFDIFLGIKVEAIGEVDCPAADGEGIFIEAFEFRA